MNYPCVGFLVFLCLIITFLVFNTDKCMAGVTISPIKTSFLGIAKDIFILDTPMNKDSHMGIVSYDIFHLITVFYSKVNLEGFFLVRMRRPAIIVS